MITACLMALCLQAGASEPDSLAALAAKSARCDQGLCLVVGDTDGRTIAALAKATRLQVQGVASDRETAAKLRAAMGNADAADRASAVWRRTPHLPYLDNLVNLIVASGWGQGDAKDLPMSEVVRVLCPGGVAILGADAGADSAALLAEAGKVRLARAEKLDRPGGWIRIVKQPDPAMDEWSHYCDGPGQTWTSNDQTVAPCREMRWINVPIWDKRYGNEVFAGGRAFHVEYDWIAPFKSQCYMVGRDAFNGTVLWPEKIVPIGRSGPHVMLAADDRRVYCMEGVDLIARDGATGAVFKNYFRYDGYFLSSVRDRLILDNRAIDKETGKTVWTRAYPQCRPVANDRAAYVLTKSMEVEAIDHKDGTSLWKTATMEQSGGGQNATIVCTADAVYVLARNLVALDCADGKVRWSYACAKKPAQVLPFGDQVWIADQAGAFTVLDAATGKETKSVSPKPFGGGCWGSRGSGRYMIIGRACLVDRQSFQWTSHYGMRASCGVGEIPAYGLLYYGPHGCRCRSPIHGVVAMSPGSALPSVKSAPQLFKGAAGASGTPAGAGDWPTYRGNAMRGNAAGAELPAELKQLWSVKLGSHPLPQVTGAAGTLFAADPERHRVAALDAATGRERWSFVAEGRVPIAPTYHNDMCLFGDSAGWVYCLDAAAGKVVWQFQAAPEQKYMCAFDGFESSWPVKSGVLVFEDVAYFIAGRCSSVDGGVTLYGLDAASGQEKLRKSFDDGRTETRELKMSDLLVSDGKSVLAWGAAVVAGANKAATARNCLKFDGGYPGAMFILDTLVSLDPLRDKRKLPADGRAGGKTIAFDQDRTVTSSRAFAASATYKPGDQNVGHCQVACTGASKWAAKDTGLEMQALLLAGARVYGAAIPEFRDSDGKPALVVLSAADGKVLQRLPCEFTPSVDGLSAVGGRLFVATTDGQVVCFGAQ